MIKYKKLEVYYNSSCVGTLAIMKDGRVAFAYDDEWLLHGFSISPFSLPLESGVFEPKSYEPFDGLFGVFYDSLPDGWGRLLVDRLLQSKGENPNEITSLDRLAIVGESGMGALSYKPIYELHKESEIIDFDYLANECKKILNDEKSGTLDELFFLGGSSGGARPKILTKIHNEDWIIKFPSAMDHVNIGEMEYSYNKCARACGLNIPSFQLFASKQCSGYFGVQRFDRMKDSHTNKVKKLHMISVSALLETSHRVPSLDYTILMKLTMMLTNNHEELMKMYRLMCFNVFGHNRDDHSNNFSFIYDDTIRTWILSPAYDLTYSYSIGGGHATSVHGNGKNPDINELLEVALETGIDEGKALIIIKQMKETIKRMLKEYL